MPSQERGAACGYLGVLEQQVLDGLAAVRSAASASPAHSSSQVCNMLQGPWLNSISQSLVMSAGPGLSYSSGTRRNRGRGLTEHLDRVLCGEASLALVWGGVLGVGLFRTGCGRSRSR